MTAPIRPTAPANRPDDRIECLGYFFRIEPQTLHISIPDFTGRYTRQVKRNHIIDVITKPARSTLNHQPRAQLVLALTNHKTLPLASGQPDHIHWAAAALRFALGMTITPPPPKPSAPTTPPDAMAV